MTNKSETDDVRGDFAGRKLQALAAEIANDPRIENALIEVVNIGVWTALNEGDFLQNTLVRAIFQFEDAKRKKRQADMKKTAKMIGRIITFPLRLTFLVILIPIAILIEAVRWKKTDAMVNRQFDEPKNLTDSLPDFLVSRVRPSNREDIIKSFIFTKRVGFSIGRWVYKKTHRKTATQAEDSQLFRRSATDRKEKKEL